MASTRSSEARKPAFHVATYSSPSATLRSALAVSTAFVPWTASGELAAISSAMLRAAARTASASGWTSFTSPMDSALAAVMSFPV